jgi:hypothetical protein
MKKEDLKEIAELVTTVVDNRFGQFKEEITEDNQRFKGEITDEFRHQRGLLLENIQHKLDIVVEGHQLLDVKIDKLDERLSGKIDAVANDLAAHRRDTEAHKGGYKAMDE